MDREDRSAVLYAAAFGPAIGLKVTISYLRMKRAARKAEKGFHRQLVQAGLPREDARLLAEEYGAAISLRELVGGLGATAQMRR
ncbi:MAG: hypothetical protein ISF22_01535 [Methanomassiliicoccus sp.]|nr:hypothetical protein [Methanomassiliicoccus sp.]